MHCAGHYTLSIKAEAPTTPKEPHSSSRTTLNKVSLTAQPLRTATSPTARSPSTMNQCSAAQLTALKTGNRAHICIGPVGNEYIGVERAYTNLLIQFSGLAKTALSSPITRRFYVKDASKAQVSWIYRL